MPLLSLANLMMPRADPFDQVGAAADAGFDAVGLCIHPGDRLQASLVVDHAQRRRVKEALKARNLTVLDIEVFPLKPDVDVAVLKPTLDAGADLGATFVLVTGNDENENRLTDNFGKLCDLALPMGLRPMLEFISYRNVADIGQADRVLKRAGRTGSGMCVDALHLFRSGGTLDDLRAIEPTAIGYAQICDAASLAPWHAFTEAELIRESRTNRRMSGEGILPLAEFLDALPPGLAISVESPAESYAHLDPTALAKVAMETTRRVLAKAKPR